MRRALILVAVALLSVPVFAERLYVHLTADDEDDGTKLELTLPFAFVDKAAEILSTAKTRGSCRIRIDGHDFEAEEMREIARGLRRGEEGALFVSRYERLHFRRAGSQIEILAEDDWDRVVTRMPADLFFAMFREDERIDFSAALKMLASRGGGEILTSTADDGAVRVWVDRHKSIRGGAR